MDEEAGEARQDTIMQPFHGPSQYLMVTVPEIFKIITKAIGFIKKKTANL